MVSLLYSLVSSVGGGGVGAVGAGTAATESCFAVVLLVVLFFFAASELQLASIRHENKRELVVCMRRICLPRFSLKVKQAGAARAN